MIWAINNIIQYNTGIRICNSVYRHFSAIMKQASYSGKGNRSEKQQVLSGYYLKHSSLGTVPGVLAAGREGDQSVRSCAML